MTKLTPPGSWAERKLAALTSYGQSEKHSHVFMTSCVSALGEDIHAMMEDQIEVTLEEMEEHCYLDNFVLEFGYNDSLALAKDPTVSFWKSTYRGCPCYFLDHSRIEYIWVKKDEWIAERMQLRFYSDPGHGWLEVPRYHLDRLGIANKITGGSYENQGLVYLEEDLDAGTYMKALKERGTPLPAIEDVYHDDSPVRGYRGYTQ